MDTLTTHSILGLLRDINEQLGVTVVVITHSLSVARQVCNKVAVIDRGRLLEAGPVEDVLVAPRSEAARRLIEADDVIRPHRPFAAAEACAKEAV